MEDVYSEFMGKDNEDDLENQKKNDENEAAKKEEKEKKEEEEAPLEMWQFVHHENGNVTMGAEMFKKLMDRLMC